MSVINFQGGYVSGAGGGSGGGDFAPGAPLSPFRTRGTIDLTLGRIPNASDVSVAILEVIYPNDVFVVTTTGTAPSGATGTNALSPGDYLLYVGGDVTLAASWCGVINAASNNVFPNCPTGFVRVIARRGDAE